jgi:hypothetical protein
VRRRLGRRWRIPPWWVDEAPGDEVAIELKIQEIMAECGVKDEE